MSINVGQVSHPLSDGSRFYAYSGPIQGDVSVPASITLISIPNTGLKDTFVKIQPFFGQEVSSSSGQQLGLQVLIDDNLVFEYGNLTYTLNDHNHYEFFVPRGSKLECISINKSGNNTQVRGVAMLGWCL